MRSSHSLTSGEGQNARTSPSGQPDETGSGYDAACLVLALEPQDLAHRRCDLVKCRPVRGGRFARDTCTREHDRYTRVGGRCRRRPRRSQAVDIGEDGRSLRHAEDVGRASYTSLWSLTRPPNRTSLPGGRAESWTSLRRPPGADMRTRLVTVRAARAATASGRSR